MRFLALLVCAACHAATPRACDVRAEIEAAIAEMMAANRAKNIDAYMATIDDDFVLASNECEDQGRHIDRAAVRADILRDWSIIRRFYEVERWITAVESTSADRAVVQTNQLYHRVFSHPNDDGEDDVVSTQKHRETWRKRGGRWRLARVEELGGAIYVNGKPYTP